LNRRESKSNRDIQSNPITVYRPMGKVATGGSVRSKKRVESVRQSSTSDYSSVDIYQKPPAKKKKKQRK